jgi:PEP-CTERM motif
LLATALTLGVAGTQANAASFAATLGVGVGGFGPLRFTGVGGGVTSTPGFATFPAWGVTGGTVLVPVSASPPFTAIVVKVNGNEHGSFYGNPLTGQMPIFGGVAVKGNLGGGPITLAYVPFFTSHSPGSTAAANGLGVGGSVLLTIGGNPAIYLDVLETIWAVGMKTVTGLPYATYVYHVPSGLHVSRTSRYTYLNGTAMYTGMDGRTSRGFGQVTLVSPIKVSTNLTGAPLTFVVLGTFTVYYLAPEPGTILLVGLGVAGLGIQGYRRERRARARRGRVERAGLAVRQVPLQPRATRGQ